MLEERSYPEVMEEMRVLQKRMRTAECSEGDGEGRVDAGGMDEEAETALVASDEMEINIQRILEKMERFTEQVSEFLEAGKSLFRDLCSEFEEKVFNLHQEHMDKWQEEIKELRMLDASNESARAILQNAQHHILRNVAEES